MLEQLATLVDNLTKRNFQIFIKGEIMKKLKFIGIFLFLGICFSCSVKDGLTQEQETDNLNQLFYEIKNLATSVDCIDSTEWIFTSYGSKACGGPMGYLAYSTNIGTVLFLEKIEEHRIAQRNFNEKWGIMSDCSIPPEPKEVICEDANPILVYTNHSQSRL